MQCFQQFVRIIIVAHFLNYIMKYSKNVSALNSIFNPRVFMIFTCKVTKTIEKNFATRSIIVNNYKLKAIIISKVYFPVSVLMSYTHQKSYTLPFLRQQYQI